MLEDPDLAANHLRETPEGCEALIAEWEQLKAPLIEPQHWDDKDAERAQALLGNFSVMRNTAPSLMNVPTDWIIQHRQVAFRLAENRWPKGARPNVRYFTEDERKKDEWMIDNLREASRLGTEWLMKIIEGQQKDLRERIAQLDADDAIDIEQATLRARADTSDEGRLLHRYQMEQERGFFKTLSVLRAERSAQRKEMQVYPMKALVTKLGESKAEAAGAVSAPNEARPAARTHNRGPIRGVQIGPEMIIATLPEAPKDIPHRT